MAELTERAQLIFAQIVESYLATGAPIGSKYLADVLQPQMSPASIRATMARLESELGGLTARLVEDDLISWSGLDKSAAASNSEMFSKSLIVHGQNHLLDNIEAMEDLERIRHLFADLDRQKEMIALLSDAEAGDGVKIFIGAETPLFSLSGSSLIIGPYHDRQRSLVGVLGVIAPTRTNYARLIPMVDHTAKLVSGLLSEK